jgi:hypothetical protein
MVFSFSKVSKYLINLLSDESLLVTTSDASDSNIIQILTNQPSDSLDVLQTAVAASCQP